MSTSRVDAATRGSTKIQVIWRGYGLRARPYLSQARPKVLSTGLMVDLIKVGLSTRTKDCRLGYAGQPVYIENQPTHPYSE